MHMKTLKSLKKLIKHHDFFYLFIWILMLQIVSYSIGQLTQTNLSSWYNPLIKSTLTPPAITFAIVWPILYTLLAVLGAIIFSPNSMTQKKIKVIYCVQLILNWSWTPIFFYLHWVGIALFILNIMLILTCVLIIQLYSTNKNLALLLIPYLIWIAFAAYLNAVIWMNI